MIEWIFRVIQFRGYIAGYRNISFEREAYANQHDPEYLEKRRRFSVIRYITKNR